MFSSRARTLLVATGFVVLAGCNTAGKPIASDDPFLGESVKYNAAIQTINPTPVYAAEGAQPGDNGAKGQAAVKRYRTDQVKQLETMETTTGSSGSGGGSGPH